MKTGAYERAWVGQPVDGRVRIYLYRTEVDENGLTVTRETTVEVDAA